VAPDRGAVHQNWIGSRRCVDLQFQMRIPTIVFVGGPISLANLLEVAR
jgi:hypothetical protein